MGGNSVALMRCLIAAIATVILVVVIAAAAFVYSGAYYIGADKSHSSATSWIIGHVRDRSIQAHASGIAVPAGLDDAEKVAVGASHSASIASDVMARRASAVASLPKGCIRVHPIWPAWSSRTHRVSCSGY